MHQPLTQYDGLFKLREQHKKQSQLEMQNSANELTHCIPCLADYSSWFNPSCYRCRCMFRQLELAYFPIFKWKCEYCNDDLTGVSICYFMQNKTNTICKQIYDRDETVAGRSQGTSHLSLKLSWCCLLKLWCSGCPITQLVTEEENLNYTPNKVK